ncbi:MAG: gluconate permease [Rhodothermaceae bacterium]|nr:gluconate permease [Rhodothermaceae bacterium]MXX59334.1 gluconate permease [Rhodothermaceae bacterium]MYD19087.1 gluconate permease [Rhodothermaceae bacterium]MYD55940.1 gluconate permease [Rhodothermaceae bacterium]MYJ57009.1 gluconate permease [Rhodothermaceae bacterium]
MTPILILLLGIIIVVGLIVGLRINAFVALIAAAIVISILSPGEWSTKITRVATAFGTTAGSIGIVIAMAAVIGVTMMNSGAADRVVQAFIRLLGQERGSPALAASGFMLSIPVFFDTVFYLLIPLARSLFTQTKRSYLKYVIAIAAGAAATHALVPPTPGPLIIAENLNVDLGTMILVGITVALPAAILGLMYAGWLNRRMTVPMRDVPGVDAEATVLDTLPGLGFSVLPIVLPIILIAGKTVFLPLLDNDTILARWIIVLGDPNMALLLAAAVSTAVYIQMRRPSRENLGKLIEQSLMSGGLIILITAAGGTFGAMLKEAQIGPAISDLFAGTSGTSGLGMLVLGFGIASLLKFAQGSSTVAMITASAMLAAMITPEQDLGFNVVYLGTAIGAGSLVGSWMNDSGFWIYSKMSGLTEVETLKSWSALLIILGISAGLMSVILSLLIPLT